MVATEGGEVISLLVVDDHEMVAESFRRALDREPDIEVVAVAATSAEAVALAAERRPRVVLMDLQLPDGDGVTAAARILATAPRTRVLILTGAGGDTAVGDALRVGCVGYLEKTSPLDQIAPAIRKAVGGELALSARDLARAVASPPRRSGRGDDLTRRELEVVRMLADGMSNGEIARELYVSIHTVRSHVRTLLAKLGARNRLEAVAAARRQGLFRQGPASDPAGTT